MSSTLERNNSMSAALDLADQTHTELIESKDFQETAEADFGDSNHCSQCQKGRSRRFKVCKIHKYLPCYTHIHYLCDRCVLIHLSPTCFIEPYPNILVLPD